MAKDQVSEEQKESIRTMLGAGNGVWKIAKTIGCLRQVVKNERKAAEAEENKKKAEAEEKEKEKKKKKAETRKRRKDNKKKQKVAETEEKKKAAEEEEGKNSKKKQEGKAPLVRRKFQYTLFDTFWSITTLFLACIP